MEPNHRGQGIPGITIEADINSSPPVPCTQQLVGRAGHGLYQCAEVENSAAADTSVPLISSAGYKDTYDYSGKNFYLPGQCRVSPPRGLDLRCNDSLQAEESSDLLSLPSPTGLKNSNGTPNSPSSKWVKLRTTVKTVGAVSSHSKKRRKSATLDRQDSFLKRFSTRHGGGANVSEDELEPEQKSYCQIQKEIKNKRLRYVIHPDENFMFYWLAVQTIAVLYNLWTCIARQAFREIVNGFEVVWYTTDALCDFIYLSDILVQLRTGYLEKGLIVYSAKKLARHYIWSYLFVIDLCSLLPLDIIQVFIGIHPLIRFPRFLKAYRTYRFVYMVETRTSYPNVWRVANLSHILFLGSHWFAAFYFMISKAERFEGKWGYPEPVGDFASVTRKYLKSLYWSTLTLTTIGDLPPPESNWEYAFTIVSYLIGVFVFATIVGQVGNVITNRNASRQEFERLLDGAKSYMRNHNVPNDMQRRVQRWYDYAWSRGRMNGGGDINSLGLLPDKLKTELALHVNLETLRKVTIFQECEPEFLHDLVLKMRAFIFTPGDLICRKGEVAREMFIIADGLLEVISDSGEVLTQMSAGDFFGEIGILNLDGGINRRTADVRSVGYAELFVLSREDVLSALTDHPEAEGILTLHGRQRLIGIRQKNAADQIQGKIRQVRPSLPRIEANPSPITNLLGVRIPGRISTGHIRYDPTLIKDFGCKRLQELGAHKRKRQERLARLNGGDGSPLSSPVHHMVNSSAGLMKSVVTLGLGACNAVTHRDNDANVDIHKDVDKTSFLQQILQLGKQQKQDGNNSTNIDRSQHQPSADVRENLPIELTQLKENNVVNSQKQETAFNMHGSQSPSNSIKNVSNEDSFKLNLIADLNGLPLCDGQLDDVLSSPDQVLVVMDTEESDLEPDTPTSVHNNSFPLLSSLERSGKMHRGIKDVTSSNRSSASSVNGLRDIEIENIASIKSKTRPNSLTVFENKTDVRGQAHKQNPCDNGASVKHMGPIKSLSLDGVSDGAEMDAPQLRKAKSEWMNYHSPVNKPRVPQHGDNDPLGLHRNTANWNRADTPDKNHLQVNGDTSMSKNTLITGSSNTGNDNDESNQPIHCQPREDSDDTLELILSDKDINISMYPTPPQGTDSSSPTSNEAMCVIDNETSRADQSGRTTSRTSTTSSSVESVHGSYDLRDSNCTLQDVMNSVHSDSTSTASIYSDTRQTRSGYPTDTSEDDTSRSLLPRSISAAVAATEASMPKSFAHKENATNRVQSRQGSRKDHNLNQKSHNEQNDIKRDDDMNELVDIVKGALRNKLEECQKHYEHRIEQLEEANRQKEVRIRQLQATLNNIQDQPHSSKTAAKNSRARPHSVDL